MLPEQMPWGGTWVHFVGISIYDNREDIQPMARFVWYSEFDRAWYEFVIRVYLSELPERPDHTVWL